MKNKLQADWSVSLTHLFRLFPALMALRLELSHDLDLCSNIYYVQNK